MAEKEVVFDTRPLDMNFFMDEKALTEAVVCQFEDGPYKGVWMFSNRARAEEFAWKRDLKYRFSDPAAEPEDDDL
jgi:hypothetical protein